VAKIDPKDVVEPSDEEIRLHMQEHKGESYYTAREKLRRKAYGGNPPFGFSSWGDYFKSI
jgi:hypothetical protein